MIDHLTATVGAVVGTSALLFFMTAPRHRQEEMLRLVPWEEQSTIARTRHVHSKFQKKKRRHLQRTPSSSSSSTPTMDSYPSSMERKTSSLSSTEEEEGGHGDSCGNSMDGSVASDQSSPLPALIYD